MRAVVTAQDRAKFAEATVYTVTYVGSRDNDHDVRWGYVQDLVRRGIIEAQIIARDADGSGERQIRVTP